MSDQNVQEKTTRRTSSHINHPDCVELRALLDNVNFSKASIVRGTKNPHMVSLLTAKEYELLGAFIATNYNVKQTADALGFSHTNVWQRLYGVQKKNGKSIKGILGKLRAYKAGEYMTKIEHSASA